MGMSKVYWTIPILGILGILEEESFGHSFLYFSVPKIYGVQLDSLHDFVRIGFVWMMDQEVSFQRVIGLASVAIMVFLGWMFYWFWFEVKKFFIEQPPFYYVLGCGGLLMLAALLDLEVFVMPGLQLLEELLEMLASVALLWSCFSLYCLLRGDSSGLGESEEG